MNSLFLVLFEIKFDGFDDFINKLIPNWFSFVVQFIALLITILIVVFIAYKPVKKYLTKRKEYVETNIKESEIKLAQSKTNLLVSEETINASNKQANQIINDAKTKAKEEASLILEKTKSEIKQMKQEAEKEIEDAKIEAKQEIQNEMIDVALEASKEILKREINEKDDKKTVKDFIDKI